MRKLHRFIFKLFGARMRPKGDGKYHPPKVQMSKAEEKKVLTYLKKELENLERYEDCAVIQEKLKRQE